MKSPKDKDAILAEIEDHLNSRGVESLRVTDSEGGCRKFLIINKFAYSSAAMDEAYTLFPSMFAATLAPSMQGLQELVKIEVS